MHVPFPRVATKIYPPTTYAVEKVDGMNVSVYFDGDNFEWYSRNGERIDSFAPLVDYKAKFEENLRKARHILLRDLELLDSDQGVNFHGELFGNRILNRINYGFATRFIVYGIHEVRDAETIIPIHRIPYIQGVCREAGFDDVVSFKEIGSGNIDHMAYFDKNGKLICVPFKSAYCDSDAEGVVLYHYDMDNHLTMRKIKIKDFDDMKTHRKALTEAEQAQKDKLAYWRDVCNQYLTENRLIDTFSKMPQAPTVVIVRALQSEVLAEVLKDYPEFAELTEKEKARSVSGVGKMFNKIKELQNV